MRKSNILNYKSEQLLSSKKGRLITAFMLVLACCLACVLVGALSDANNSKSTHAHADTNGDICCAYTQTGVSSATIQVTGVSDYTVTSADPLIASATQSGDMVTVEGVGSAVGIAHINIAYSAGTYTVEVPIGYTVFSFDEDTLTVMPGSDDKYEVYGIDYTQEDEVAMTPTVISGYNVYSNTDSEKINVNLKKKGGTYVFTGHGDNMSVSVNKEASATSTILMADCHLTSGVTSPLTIKKDGTVQTVVTALAGHSNSLTDNEFNNADLYGEEGTISHDNQYWAESAVIKGKTSANLLLNGTGNLTLTCKSKNGVKVGESGNLTIENIHLDVESVDHGISSDNTTTINSGSLVLNSVGDALRSDPDEVAAGTTAGTIAINGGTFDITTNSDGDGIQAAADLNITDGDFNITTGGGHSQSIGEDESAKGVKSGATLEISGGEFVLDCADDAVHSDSHSTISAGHFKIATADDAMHAGDSDATVNDAKLTLGTNGGTEPYVYITTSYEGLEGTQVIINSGTYSVTATDDGVNAANGTETTPGVSAGCNIIVNGGNVYVNVDGDGFDANGDITINAGMCVVFGQKSGGDNNPYDCDGSFYINGGTVFGAGSGGGMQSCDPSSSSKQTYVKYGGQRLNNENNFSSEDNQTYEFNNINPGPGGQGISANQTVDVKNASSTTAFSVKTPKDVNYVIYSSSETTSSWSITGDTTTPTWSGFTMPTCLSGSHNYTSAYVVEPNCLGAGTIKKTCSVCGATSYETVSALGHNMVDNECTRCGYGEGTKTDISSATVTFSAEEQPYTFTGSAIFPTTTVTLNGVTLTENNYSLSYSNNVNAGTGTVTVTGIHDYKGSVSKDFTINKASIDKPTAVEEVFYYDGTEHIGVKEGAGYTIFDNKKISAGNYTAVATLDSNHIWSDGETEQAEIQWEIYRATGNITFSSSEIDVVINRTGTVVPTIVSDGEITATCAQTDIAEISYTDGILSVTGKSLGDATVTLTASAGTNYTATNATLTVYVVSAGKAKDPVVKTDLVYNGQTQTGVEVGTGYTLTNNTGINAESYTATATLDDDYEWADGSTSKTKYFDWSIARATGVVTISSSSASVAISKSTTISTYIVGDGEVKATTSDDAVATASIKDGVLTVNGIGKGSATITVSVKQGTNYTAASDSISISVDYIDTIKAPDPVGNLTYNGFEQIGVEAGTGYTLTGNTGTNAGPYIATATLESGYIWNDGTLDAKTINWSIAKADGQISLEQTSVTVERGSSVSVAFTRAGDGTVTATSSEESVATVSVASGAVSITGVAKNESCTVTVNVDEGSNHNATSAVIAVNVTYTPTISSNGITLRGLALENVLKEGEQIQLAVTKQSETDEGYIKAYKEFMTSGDYKQMLVYDVVLTAYDTTEKSSRTITELPDTVEMTIALGTSEYNGNGADVQEYHTTEAGKEVTIPYKGLKVDDNTVKLDVSEFSQFNVLIAKDTVVPGEDTSGDSAVNSGTSSSTGDMLAGVIVFAVFVVVIAGFCAYGIRRKANKN